jgi:hypothetical protein
LRSMRHLKHVKIAVAVTRTKRLDRHPDQEIALSGVASALAFRRMADALSLMQRVPHMIHKSGLFKNPLAIRRPGELGRRQKHKGQKHFRVHEPFPRI